MKKTLSFLLAIIVIAGAAVSAAVPAAAAGFSDVEADRWSAPSIRYAANQGYMTGVGGDIFDPEGTLTRAAAVTVLWRRQGEPGPAAPCGFSDVPAGQWYSEAVAWAKEAGVAYGVTDNAFDPEGPVTREQLAAILFRYSSFAPVFVPERADLGEFEDGGTAAGYAAEPLGWAVEAGLIKGDGDGRLDPKGHATREQFAAIMERYDDTFKLEYNEPVITSHYTEKPYPLVTDADIYVSTSGEDENDGTFDRPLATFGGAVAKVREIKETKTEGDITVAFMAGVYGPVEAELYAADGGSEGQRIIYCKYGDGDVIFDNGATIPADAFLPLDESDKAMFQSASAEKIKKVDVGALLGEIPSVENFALFTDEKYCNVARYPNLYDDGSDRFLKGGNTNNDDPALSTLLITSPVLYRRFAAYSERMIREMLLYGYIVRGYRKDTFTIESYDSDTKMLTVGYGSSSEFSKKLRRDWNDALMAVLNVPYELDVPGEYWVDRETGTLYVYDPEGTYRIPMPHGEKRIRGIVQYDTGDGYPASEGYCAIYAEDTGYITFRGIRFTSNVDEFFIGYRTSGFEFDRCRFDCCTGKNQILFEHSLPDVPLGLRVTDCEFDLCIGRHVYVFDEANGPERFTNRSEILVDNCYFARSNLLFDAEGAVNLHCCSGGLVSHNQFENCYRYAVMFTGSCDVVVEYNDFESAMTNSDDGGVTRGCHDVQGNNVVRYNFYNSIANGGSVGRMAHYCDCGTLMYSNLIYDGGYAVYHGAGRDNELNCNVMIGPNAGASVGSLTEGIIATGEISGAWSLVPQWNTVRTYIETVPGYAEALEARRPGILDLLFDIEYATDKAFFLAPTNTFIGNLFINEDARIHINLVNNSADYCTVEGNVACTYDENPVFVNPTVGDYRIRSGVDFPDIHFEEIGRY